MGVVSQLGTCLLSWDEVYSEFRLLPVNYGEREPIQKRYFVLLAAIYIGLFGIFIYANHIADEVRSTDQYTVTDQWIDDTSKRVISIDLWDDAREYTDQFVARRNDFINGQRRETIEQIDDYYDACARNVDAYIDWYNSLPATAGRFIPIIGENMVRDEFDKQIVDPVSKEDINSQYVFYLHGLENFYDKYWNAKEITALLQQASVLSASEIVDQKGIPAQLQLWVAWNSEESKKIVQEVLLGKGADTEDAKARILSYIENQREKTIGVVEDMADPLFPSIALAFSQ